MQPKGFEGFSILPSKFVRKEMSLKVEKRWKRANRPCKIRTRYVPVIPFSVVGKNIIVHVDNLHWALNGPKIIWGQEQCIVKSPSLSS